MKMGLQVEEDQAEEEVDQTEARVVMGPAMVEGESGGCGNGW